MDLVVLGLRLLLAAVLLVSAIAKLIDLEGSRRAVRGFRLPGGLVPAVAVAVPLAELAVALLLLFAATTRVGAAAALALFAVFTVTIANQLRQGNAPVCHCFGALSTAPVGPRTLLRNGALIALAGAVIALGRGDAGPGLEALGAWSTGTLIVLVTLVVGVALAALCGVLTRRLSVGHDRLAGRLDDLARSLGNASGDAPAASRGVPGTAAPGSVPASTLSVGTLVPAFRFTRLGGDVVSAETPVVTGRPLALLLSAESCQACHSLLPEIARWQRDLAPDVDLTLVGLASGATYRPALDRHGIVPAAVPDDDTYRQVMGALRVEGVPSLVVIGPDGRLSHPVAGGVDAIRGVLADLARQVTGRDVVANGPIAVAPAPAPAPVEHHAPDRQTPPVGTPVPAFALVASDGRPVRLVDVATRTDLTLVLFWRADCPHCLGLNGTIRAWRAGLDPDAIQIVAISPGAVDDIAALGIADLTFTDPSSAGHDAFGVSGSPSAILLDRSGRIASALVNGSRELDIALRRIRGPLIRPAGDPAVPVAADLVVTGAR